jgi:tRNA wybutosine-synthesizing protein 4
MDLIDPQNEAASIETNSYSIVSKRSVEKLYFANEPPFLKPFVPKFKRRAPFINRGHWLRMRAIQGAVNDFLLRHAVKPKIVINLGSGYDPLPFRLKHKSNIGTTKFIDIDYEDLIKHKLRIIQEDPLLNQLIDQEPTIQKIYGDGIVSSFGWYSTVGCDLGDIERMSRMLEDIINIEECDILFIAEVSISYMPLRKADAVLHWSASHEKGWTCQSASIINANRNFSKFPTS